MTFPKPLKWLGVDFDGTLFNPLWSIENPTSDIGEPIWANVIKAKLAYEAGYKISSSRTRSTRRSSATSN